MALNGISTLPDKSDRKIAKIALATTKREADGTVGYRMYNYFVGSVSPAIGRPWALSYTGGGSTTGQIIGGLAATTQFTDPPIDGGNNNASGVFVDNVDGGGAVFV